MTRSINALAARGIVAGTMALLGIQGSAAPVKRCAFVTSYHKGYEWNDGIERGLRRELEGKCEVTQFDMDTKRNPDPAFAVKAAKEIKEKLDALKPDIVITSDDNASKYLVVPYYKNQGPNVVFCGVNWSAAEYGFPFTNVTGMIEVHPIEVMLREVKATVGKVEKVTCIGADNESEGKNCGRYERNLIAQGVKVKLSMVKTQDKWEQAIVAAQDQDYIIFTNNAGIDGWDGERSKAFLEKSNTRLIVSISNWMLPWSTLVFAAVPEEQGTYAAKTALAIMSGKHPADFPIVPNSEWDVFVNASMAKHLNIKVPDHLVRRAAQTM